MDAEHASILLGLVWAVKGKLRDKDGLYNDLELIARELDAKAIRARAFATEKTVTRVFDGWSSNRAADPTSDPEDKFEFPSR